MSSSASDARKPYLVIRPRTGWTSLDLKEVWQFRDLLLTLAGRDVRLRYRQTLLGILWVVVQPLLAGGILAFVFGRVARLPSEGIPYFLYTYAGLLAWNAFQSILLKASSSLVQNSQLVSKVFFPRILLPLSIVPGALLDFLVTFSVLVLMLAGHQLNPGLRVMLLPVWLALVILLALGIGLIACALAVSYRDVQYILPVALQFALYASPVAYSAAAVPVEIRPLLLLNPLSALLEAFRWSLFGTGSLHVGYLIYSTGAALLLFGCGVLAFRGMERRFADVI